MSGKQIDWDKIHLRIREVKAAIEAGGAPELTEKRRILDARAERLARPVPQRNTEETIEVVEFLLAEEHYGIETSYIGEVYPLKDYTPLPGVPPFVLGLLNVRGRMVSIIDIKKFFDLPDKGLSDLNKIIIINDDKMEFGILADTILGVVSLAVSELQPSLTTLTGIRREFLKGITGERLVVLDANRILSDQSIVVHEEV